jgi:hypothetical protein
MTIWRGNLRDDGMTVRMTQPDRWAVRWIADDGSERLVTECPCCTLPLDSAHAARKVADAFFPPPEQAS